MLSLSGCVSETGMFGEEEYTISGTGEKSPLQIDVTIKDSYAGPNTRALNGVFEKNDQLIAFVQQVKLDNSNITSVGDGAALVSKLVTFTVGAAGDQQSTVTTDNLGVTLYWDDFSNTTDDITSSDRRLRVGYGFCYNGGTPSTALNEANATVGWTVLDNQQEGASDPAADKIRKSDLLWAGNQNPVKYDHDHVRPGVANIVKLPVTYTHAMSKVTIEIVLDEGFATKTDGKAVAFGDNETTPVLYANKAATVVDAINQTLKTTEVSGDAAKITMRLAEDESTPKRRVYEAIIAPTVMKAGNLLATVEVDGNKYELKLTDELLKTLPTGVSGNTWASQLYGYTQNDGSVSKSSSETQQSAEHPDGITLSGINYRLIAKLKKQRIEVEAKILPWDDVYASMDGKISFNADVVTSEEKDGSASIAAGSFDLWRATANTLETDYDYNRDTSDGITKASTYQYTTTGKWEVMSGNNILYWENATTPYYFRALATAGGYDSEGKVTSLTHVDCTDKDGRAAAQGIDLLWAQTTKHEAKDANGNPIPHPTEAGKSKVYEAGEAIDPRTGNVPLTFEHAMSKISVTLATTTGEDKVDLTDATISIINLYNGGTIRVMDGTIADLTAPASNQTPMTIDKVATTAMKTSGVIVIPQSLIAKEDGSARDITPVFYSSDELTGIYSNGSSLAPNGETTPTKYYVTRELTAVPAVLYEASIPEDVAYINAENAKLPGAVKIDDVKEPAVTQVNYDYAEFNSQSVKRHQHFTRDDFDLLEDAEHPTYKNAKIKTPYSSATYYDSHSFTEFKTTLDETKYLQLPESFRAILYTCEEYNTAHRGETGFTDLTDEQFAALPEADKRKPNSFYTYTDFSGATGDLEKLFADRLDDDNILPKENKVKDQEQPAVYYSYEQYITLEAITQDMFNALPPVLKIKIPAKAEVLYKTDDEVNAYNATLEGALHVGDVKIPAHYELPGGKTPSTTSLISHEVGTLETVGDKIMLYVFLKDGTRYSAELSLCQETDADGSPLTNTDGSPKLVKVWEPNHHYHYTITLAKDQITFRALVKDWVVKRVGGSATLDWD